MIRKFRKTSKLKFVQFLIPIVAHNLFFAENKTYTEPTTANPIFPLRKKYYLLAS